MPERLEVRRAVAAPVSEIFALLTDPRGHVAIDSSGMLMEASGDTVTKAGDTFLVHMDREALNDYPLGLYDVTVEIVTFIPDREIAWTIHGQLELGHVYGYRLEPIAEGTVVTSYYDWSAAGQKWKDSAIFPVIPQSALRATLGILARTVAPGKPRPALPEQRPAPAVAAPPLASDGHRTQGNHLAPRIAEGNRLEDDVHGTNPARRWLRIAEDGCVSTPPPATAAGAPSFRMRQAGGRLRSGGNENA